ncbi:MAG: contractile injection system protein, VgrG/Pvc8 family [Aequoribacter sp.]|uniref:contractile injection system protein, VgrG/Pvc8 family n=1 Tax=Aequoribacter sp. TaxID=2847771 RepID=UPI003C659786
MRPDFRIIADAQDITEVIRDRLLSLRLTDESGTQSDALEIQLDDRDAVIKWPTHGAELLVSLGDTKDNLVVMGVYTVDEIEHTGPPQTLTIRAKAADKRASLKAPKSRSWDSLSLGELVRTIAAEHELEPKIAEALDGFLLEHLDQTDESDLHLLTRLAREQGAVAKPVAGNLVFVPKGEARSATGQAIETLEVLPTQVRRHRFTQAGRGKYSAVKAFWHDANNAEKQSIIVGDGEPVFAIRHTYSDAQQATAAASAKLKSLTRGTATLSLTLLGNPLAQAEGKLRVGGIRDPVNGEWVVTRVEHQLDASGLQTRCDAEVPNS